MKVVEAWQNYDPDSLKLKRPDIRLEYDYRPALREAVRMKRTGDPRMRSLAEVTEFDEEWENDVWTAWAELEYLKDYYTGLDPETRAKLEQVNEAPIE